MKAWVARVCAVVSGVLLIASAIPTLARLWPGDNNRIALLVVFTPHAGLGLLLALLLALAAYALNRSGRRSRVLLTAAVLSTAGIVLQVAWAAPFYAEDPRPGPDGRRTLVVMTSNLYKGQADPEAIVREVKARKVELFSATELTIEAREGLRRAGLDDALPYSYPIDKPGGQGTGIWSAHPIADQRKIGSMQLKNLRVQLQAGRHRIVVVSVHPVFPRSPIWGADHAELRTFLRTATGPAIVLGDFNATADNVPMRNLEADGFRNAADVTGAGRVPTWPVGGWAGPLFGIDHVLVRNGVRAERLESFDVPGSDHRSVVAELSLPGPS